MGKQRNIVLLVAVMAALAAICTSFAYAQTTEGDGQQTASSAVGLAMLGAGLAIAGAGAGAGIGLGIGTSAIVAAGVEKPEMIAKFFIFIVFIEAIAIYGLIISFLIIFTAPTL